MQQLLQIGVLGDWEAEAILSQLRIDPRISGQVPILRITAAPTPVVTLDGMTDFMSDHPAQLIISPSRAGNEARIIVEVAAVGPDRTGLDLAHARIGDKFKVEGTGCPEDEPRVQQELGAGLRYTAGGDVVDLGGCHGKAPSFLSAVK